MPCERIAGPGFTAIVCGRGFGKTLRMKEEAAILEDLRAQARKAKEAHGAGRP